MAERAAAIGEREQHDPDAFPEPCGPWCGDGYCETCYASDDDRCETEGCPDCGGPRDVEPVECPRIGTNIGDIIVSRWRAAA